MLVGDRDSRTGLVGALYAGTNITTSHSTPGFLSELCVLCSRVDTDIRERQALTRPLVISVQGRELRDLTDIPNWNQFMTPPEQSYPSPEKIATPMISLVTALKTVLMAYPDIQLRWPLYS